jgi:SAM-dependent methyltransferase
MPMPFARALHDLHFDEQQGPYVARNGEETVEQSLDFYFEDVQGGGWLEARLDGPLLDLGAGVGRHALYFQERFETVAIEQSPLLVEVMRDRGVEDARVADMFGLREAFERDRFASALAVGTQVGLAGSMAGLREFLGDLAFVTTPDATAVVDGYRPGHERTREKIDYRPDPAPGLAYRVAQFEYDGTLGEPWLYRLFSPDRVREAAVGTGWEVGDVRIENEFYNLELEKR